MMVVGKDDKAEILAKPHRRFELRMQVSGDDWPAVIRELHRFVETLEERGKDAQIVSGGYDSGGYFFTVEDPEMTHDRWYESLQAHLAKEDR